MGTLLESILGNAVMVVPMALAAALVSLCRPRPAVVHVAWLIVLAKLVTPPLFSAPTPDWRSAAAGAHRSEPARSPEIQLSALPGATPVESRDQSNSERPATEPKLEDVGASRPERDRATSANVANARPDVVEETSVAGGTAEVVDRAPRNASSATVVERSIDWPGAGTVLLLVWGAGSLVCLVTTLSRIASFHKLLRVAKPAAPEVRAETRRLADRLGLRQAPDVVTLPSRLSPLIWPIGRRVRLVLPEELLAGIDGKERTSLITHELIHLSRRDHWVRLLELVTTVLYWWHPVVWWARSRLRRAEEQCCDAAVVQAWPGEARAYADALLRTVRFLADAPGGFDRRLPLPASGLGNLQVLQQRLTMIFDGSVPARLSVWNRAALLLVAAVLLPLVPGPAAVSDDPGPSSVATAEDLPADATEAAVVTATFRRPSRSTSPVVFQSATEGLADEPVDPAQGSFHVFSGVVRDVDGHPAARAKVWLADRERRRVGPSSRVYADGVCDDDGRFELRARVTGNDFRVFFVQALGAHGRFGWTAGRRLIDLPSKRTDIDLRAVKDYRGKVVDADGNPVPGAVVTPVSLWGSSFRGQSTVQDGGSTALAPELGKRYEVATDAEGNFTLPMVPLRGSVGARVSAPGYGAPVIRWDLSAPTTILLQRAGSVRGSLVGNDKETSLAGVRLDLALRRGTGATTGGVFELTYKATTKSVNDGSFHFENVPLGKYTITGPIGGEHFHYVDSSAPFDLRPDEALSTPSLPLRNAIAIRGRILDPRTNAGVKGIDIVVSRTDPKTRRTRWDSSVRTKTGGTFEVHVKPGFLSVGVSKSPPDYHPGPRLFESKEISADLRLPPATLALASTVAGTVVDEAGAVVPGATVFSLGPSRGGSGRSESDRNGAFTIRRLYPTDTYPILARTATAVTAAPLDLIPNEAKAPIRLVVSEKKAFRIRGVVADQSGNPIARARVSIRWMRHYKSKRVRISASLGVLEDRATDTRGVFESQALWPGQTYQVEVGVKRYAGAQSARIVGRPGETHEVPEFRLARIDRSVTGRVADSNGRPMRDVRVFNSGDAPFPISGRTDADGRFRLDDLFAGPVHVFAEKPGYRFSGTLLGADDDSVTVTLLRKEEFEPTAPIAIPVPSFAEQKKTAARLLEQLWELPEAQRKTATRDILKYMGRVDLEKAMRWSEQAGGGFDAFVRASAAEVRAKTDPAAALELLKQSGGKSGFEAALGLGEKSAESDAATALRFAEEAAKIARSLEGRDRITALAQAGGLLSRLGKAQVGRPMIEQAAQAAERLGTSRHDGYVRHYVSEQLAPVDLDRALNLADSIADPNARESAIALVAVTVGASDTERALALVGRLELPFYRDKGKVDVAVRIAARRPAAALRIVEAVETKYHAQAFGRLAVEIAPLDASLAFSLIDRSLALYLDEPDLFGSWRNWGGRNAFAARVAIQAARIDYPDMRSVVQRVLATRSTKQELRSPASLLESRVSAALFLGFVDPTVAKRMLQGVEPQSRSLGSIPGSTRRKQWYQAWALVDAPHAAELFERELAAGRRRPKFDLHSSGLLALINLLTMPPEERETHLLQFFWGV